MTPEEGCRPVPHPANQVVPMATQYLYVDGGALRGRIKNLSEKFFGGITLNVDFKKLKGSFTKAFYYDAIPVQEDGEDDSKYGERLKPIRAIFKAALSTDGFHVYEGDARRRRKRGLEQRKVDVMLTVDMLRHTFMKNMLSATLLTGDGDFKPLLDALVELGMFVTLWYPEGETNQELIDAADSRYKLGWYDLHSLFTEESQKCFDIPHPAHQRPNAPRGQLIYQWVAEDKSLGLHYLQADREFLLTRDDDPSNTLHMKHASLELLRQCCLEAKDIKIPGDAIAAAAPYQVPPLQG
jgi:uncharacterized LabA/DUF88 family protein